MTERSHVALRCTSDSKLETVKYEMAEMHIGYFFGDALVRTFYRTRAV